MVKTGRHENLLVEVVEDNVTIRDWFINGKSSLQEPLPEKFAAQFLATAIAIVEGVKELHKKEILHGGISCDTLLVNPNNGTVSLKDIGSHSRLSETESTKTDERHLLGNPAYISPEQTGRINRGIDFRSDLYSVGIAFYEMLAQRLPFQSSDPLILIHCQIAKTPTPLKALTLQPQNRIPVVLSDMVGKLLDKNPDQRYQSCNGLLFDLRQCQRNLQRAGDVGVFVPGKKDPKDRLMFSGRLYGRDAEIAQIVSGFESAARGKKQTVFIAGYSGVGKTSLALESHGSILEQDGKLCLGKFDLPERNIPYAGFIGALRHLIRQLLIAPEPQIEQWHRRIIKRVQTNGQLLIDAIPEIEKIIGPQPDVGALPPMERQNRLSLTFRNLLRALSGNDFPLVLYLDDLQWADMASLSLLKELILDPKLKHIMIIGAYRDNEVSALHPLTPIIETADSIEDGFVKIELGPLTHPHISEMLSDLLDAEPSRLMEFTGLIMTKTNGNPFFVKQFLSNLYKTRLLGFDDDLGRWTWSQKEIEDRNFTDNVIDLMVARLVRLPVETLEVLKVAAFLGHVFNAEIPAMLMKMDRRTVEEKLHRGVINGMIRDISIHPFVAEGNGESTLFEFVHDKIQEACIGLMSKDDGERLHLQIGRILLLQARDNGSLRTISQEKDGPVAPPIIFDIVSHLNGAIALISDPREKRELAVLNIAAGRRAKSAAAFDAAAYHLETAREIIGKNGWTDDYDLSLLLHTGLLESHYALGQYETVESLAVDIRNHAQDALDTTAVFEIMLSHYQGAARYFDAIEFGRNGLDALGFPFPRLAEIQEADVEKELHRFREQVAKHPLEQIDELARCTDPKVETASAILMGLTIPVWVTAPTASSYLFLRLVNLTLEKGVTRASTSGMALLSGLLCELYDDIDTGYALGMAAIALQKSQQDATYACSVELLVYGNLHYWRNPLSAAKDKILQAYYKGIGAGSTQWASYCINHYCLRVFLIGEPLSSVAKTYDKLSEDQRRLRKIDANELFDPPRQLVANLLGSADNLVELEGEFYKSSKRIPIAMGEKNSDAKSFAETWRLFLRLIFGKFSEALRIIRGDNGEMLARRIQFQGRLATFMSAIGYLKNFASLGAEEKDKLVSLSKDLAAWAKINPTNFLAMHLAVQAETDCQEGRSIDAVDNYNGAIKAAAESGFLYLEGMIHELAASFWSLREQAQYATHHLKGAHEAYTKWGATAKIEALENANRELFLKTGETGVFRGDTGISNLSLDFASITKAINAITTEINLARLPGRMLQIMMESAGAGRGLIVLTQGDGLTIPALADNDSFSAKSNWKSNSSQVPYGDAPLSSLCSEAIVRYVMRTGETVVLQDAAKDITFGKDPYIRSTQAHSVLAMPISHLNKPLGVIYLENDLSSDVFSAERIAVIEILAGQSAISLNNATLFAQQQETEAALRASEVKYKTLLENLPQRVFLKDTNSCYISCNAAYAEDLGIHPDEIVGKDDFDFYPKELADKYRLDDAEVVASGHPRDLEEAYVKDNVSLLIHTVKTPVRNENGDAVALLGIFWDVTEKREAEKQQKRLEAQLRQSQKMDALGQLAGGVAHDFNNLLGGIIGYADLLSLTLPENSTEAKYAQRIDNAATRASDLTKQLLAFSRKGKLQTTDVSIHGIIDEVVHLLERTIDKRVEIVQKLNAFPDSAMGDPAQIQNAVLNLGVNARDAMPDGGVLTIETEIVTLDEASVAAQSYRVTPGQFVIVRVTDTGIGMTDEIKKRAFEPFFTTKADTKGTGLGLAGVYGSVKNHGGLVQLHSVFGEGTEFAMYLPAAKETNQRPVSNNIVANPQQRGHVMLVDDEDVIQEMGERALVSLGYTVTVCEDGIEAERYYREHHQSVDLIILDLIMPRLSGEETFQRLKRINPNLKLLISSGYAQNELVTQLLESGASGFLSKPFRLSELSDAIGKTLR